MNSMMTPAVGLSANHAARPRRLLYFVTEDWYFWSHRLPLALAAQQAGWEVHLLTRVRQHGERLRHAGISVTPLELARSGRHPLRELRTVLQVISAYRRLRPQLVHQVAIKPVLYGCLAAWLTGVPAQVNALAGLGYVFSSRDRLAQVLRPLLRLAFRLLLDRERTRVILQNPDDEALLLRAGLIDPRRTVIVRGSGVDPLVFTPAPAPEGEPLVVLPARLLWDKGVGEFVEAARILREHGVSARFALVGDPDPQNPASIPRDQLEAWRAEGAVELWGWREDMPAVFRQCSIVCLPSYREGLPKGLIDAAAAGLALVTCDVPGCREVVRDGDNGLLVPARDSAALAAALLRLLEDPPLRARFGERSRARAAAEFSVQRVVQDTLAVYAGLSPP